MKHLEINWKGIGMIILILSFLFVMFFGSDIIYKFKPQKVTYCRFETEFGQPLPRHECRIMKVVSKDYINFQQFASLENTTYQCSSNLEELENCSGDYMFYSMFALSLFCKQQPEEGICNFDGYLCNELYINWYDNSSLMLKLDYVNAVAEAKYTNKTELRQALINCER